jgi:hypothetical protein
MTNVVAAKSYIPFFFTNILDMILKSREKEKEKATTS